MPVVDVAYPAPAPAGLISVQYLPTSGSPTYVTEGTTKPTSGLASSSNSESMSNSNSGSLSSPTTALTGFSSYTSSKTATITVEATSYPSSGSAQVPQTKSSISSSTKLAIGLGAGLGCALLVLILCVVFYMLRRRKSAPQTQAVSHDTQTSTPYTATPGGSSLENLAEVQASKDFADSGLPPAELPGNGRYFELAATLAGKGSIRKSARPNTRQRQPRPNASALP
jgi:hypothetical protein